ncbi:MAG: hypothetical protein R2756_08800 [Bacteroidales bacterium]
MIRPLCITPTWLAKTNGLTEIMGYMNYCLSVPVQAAKHPPDIVLEAGIY